MDQKKTCLPYDSVEQMSAADTGNTRISQAVMGAIIHGVGKFIYVSDGQLVDLKGGDFGKDYEYLCQMMLRKYIHLVIAVLQDLIQQLPPNVDTLYLQVDGSTENINMSVMCYLELLVEARRFE